MSEPRWLAYAWAEVGQKELSGARHNRRILGFFKQVGHGAIKRDETAWCAAFVGACLERAGLRCTRSLMARSYLSWGDDAAERENVLGAVAVFSRGSNPAHGHVGFYLGGNRDTVWVLGGNQSNSVRVSAYPRARLLALRWPGDVARETNEPSRSGEGGENLFRRALEHVLEMEGGFSNDPVDPGGPTNKGITIGVFAAWRDEPLNGRTRGRLLSDLKSISDETVRAIYKARYWDLAHCAEFPAAIALMHFDASVNHGVGTAVRFLQRAVGVDADGEVGPMTRKAVRARDVSRTLEAYARLRRKRYRSLRHFWRFGRGWLRRVDVTVKRARALISASDVASPAGRVRERVNDMTEFRVERPGGGGKFKWWGQSVTIWGAVVSAAATIVPVAAGLSGVEISPELVRKIGGEALLAAQAVVGFLGTAAAIYGRVRADTTLVRRSVRLKL